MGCSQSSQAKAQAVENVKATTPAEQPQQPPLKECDPGAEAAPVSTPAEDSKASVPQEEGKTAEGAADVKAAEQQDAPAETSVETGAAVLPQVEDVAAEQAAEAAVETDALQKEEAAEAETTASEDAGAQEKAADTATIAVEAVADRQGSTQQRGLFGFGFCCGPPEATVAN